jgi:hypothetical protein
VAGQFTIWDRLKQAGQLRKGQLSNLARLTAFLVQVRPGPGGFLIILTTVFFQERVQSLGILKVNIRLICISLILSHF